MKQKFVEWGEYQSSPGWKEASPDAAVEGKVNIAATTTTGSSNSSHHLFLWVFFFHILGVGSMKFMGKLKCIKSALSRIYIAITASCWGDVRCTRVREREVESIWPHPSGAELPGLYSCQRCQFCYWKVCLATNNWELPRDLQRNKSVGIWFSVFGRDFLPLNETICFIYSDRSVSR